MPAKCLTLLRPKRNNLLNYIMSLFGENWLERTPERGEEEQQKRCKASQRAKNKYVEGAGGPENGSVKAKKRRNRTLGYDGTFCWERGARGQETRRRRIWVLGD